MLNIAKIRNGLVIDHIRAGQGIRIFNWLRLDGASAPVAFIVNAPSKHMGKKDMLKIDETIAIDYAVLGLIDPNITVNVIENEVITEKIRLKLPERVENVLVCKNPRCITQLEKAAPQVFILSDREKGMYRCEYCDESRGAEDFRG
jgi:aspartate carbamoyltransferase regulatory subunit